MSLAMDCSEAPTSELPTLVVVKKHVEADLVARFMPGVWGPDG